MRARKLHASLFLAAAGVASCGADPASTSAPDPSQLSYPADVARVVQAQCVTCHAGPPRYGAPMSLTTYAATQAAAVTTPSRMVWQLMGTRVHDTARPMPPSRLADADLAVIDAWVAAGAPGCRGAACGTVQTDPQVTSPSANLPCPPSERSVFLAHATGATTPFHLPGGAGNQNRCFVFPSTFDGTQQATAMAARVDNGRVLHHVILFGSATRPSSGDMFDCEQGMPPDAQFLAGWAPGNQGTVLPPDVGIGLPDRTAWFILQVHYWNNTPDPADDASGIEMCVTNTPRTHNAAVHTLGTLDIAVPPRSTGYETSGACTPTSTEPVHIIASLGHMHRLGVAIRTDVLRGGAATQSDALLEVPDYTFDTQVSRPSTMLVMPGDRLVTRCRYDNPSNSTVFFGPRTEDEMCFDFVVAWPAGALSNAAGAASRRCIDVVH